MIARRTGSSPGRPKWKSTFILDHTPKPRRRGELGISVRAETCLPRAVHSPARTERAEIFVGTETRMRCGWHRGRISEDRQLYFQRAAGPRWKPAPGAPTRATS